MNWYRIKTAQWEGIGQISPSVFEGPNPELQEKGPYHLKPKSRAKVPPSFKMPSSTDTADEIFSRIDSINKDIDSEKSDISKQIQMNPQFENIYNSLLGNFESFSNLLRKTKTDLARNFSTTNSSLSDMDQKIKEHETKKLEDNLRKRKMEEIESERGGKLEEEFENLTPEQKEERLQNQLKQQEEYRKQYPGKRFTPLEGSPEYKKLIKSLYPEKKYPPELEKLRALHNLKQKNIPKHKSPEEAMHEYGKTPEEIRRENLKHLQEISAFIINSLVKYANYFDKNGLFKRADSLDNLSNKILELVKII